MSLPTRKVTFQTPKKHIHSSLHILNQEFSKSDTMGSTLDKAETWFLPLYVGDNHALSSGTTATTTTGASFLQFVIGFMDIRMRWISGIMISLGSVSHTESKNMCITSVRSDLTELCISEGGFFDVKFTSEIVLRGLNSLKCLSERCVAASAAAPTAHRVDEQDKSVIQGTITNSLLLSEHNLTQYLCLVSLPLRPLFSALLLVNFLSKDLKCESRIPAEHHNAPCIHIYCTISSFWESLFDRY